MNPSDAISIERLLTNDGWLRPLVAHLVDAADLDDLLQDTRVAALEMAPPQLHSPKAWLRTVACNLASRRRRGQQRQRRREELAAKPERVRSTDELCERVDAQRRVSQAVLDLPEPLRAAVLLRYYEGLNATEIGERLGVPAATIRTRLRRGIQQVRAALERDLGTDWRAGCAPVLTPHVLMPALPKPHGEAGASGAGLFSGILIMTTTPKFLAPTALLLAATGLLWLWLGGAPAAEPPLRDGEPAAAPLTASGFVEPAELEVTARERTSLDAAPLDAGPRGDAPTATWRGRVLNTHGEPVPLVALALDPVDDNNPARGVAIGTSDPRGEFELDAPGQRGVLAAAGRANYTLYGFPVDSRSVDDAVLIVVPAITVAGKVYDPDHRPLEGVEVDLTYYALATFPEALDRNTRSTFEAVHTAPNGSFVLPHVPATAQASIQFRLDGRVVASRPCPLVPVADFDVVLRVGDPGEAELVGIVVDQNGRLLAEVAVRLGDVRRTSDAFGEFRIPVRDDSATLCATKLGHVPAVVEGVGRELAAQHDAANPLVMALTEGTLAIEGRVVDAIGAPRNDLLVTILDPTELGLGQTAEEFVRDAAFDGKAVARTDPAGRFEIPGLFRRSYRLRIYDRESLANVTTEPVAAGTSDLEVRLADDSVFHSVAGRVVTRSGDPVPGARIAVGMNLRRYGVVTQTTSGPVTETDTDGAFAFETLPRHGVHLTVNSDEILETRIVVEADANRELARVVVALRCHVRIETPAGADHDTVRFVDAAGETVRLRGITKGMQWIMPSWPTDRGNSPVFALSDRAIAIVFLAGKREVRREPLTLAPGKVTVVR